MFDPSSYQETIERFRSMVFSSVSDSESPFATAPRPMASIVSAKSQPLHNFSLSDLKWSMNPATTHRIRRHVPDSDGKFSVRDATTSTKHSESDSDYRRRLRPQRPSPEAANKDSENPSPKTFVLECRVEEETAAANVRSKILLRFRSKDKSTDVAPDREKQTPTQAQAQAQTEIPALSAAEPQESTSRVWNLRSRKLLKKRSALNSSIGSPARNGGSDIHEIRPLSADRSDRVAHDGGGDEARKEAEKVKLSVALSKEEIEADFLILTGAKPPRRPKKRPRAVQKQVDVSFPGLWLPPSVAAHLYAVSSHVS